MANNSLTPVTVRGGQGGLGIRARSQLSHMLGVVAVRVVSWHSRFLVYLAVLVVLAHHLWQPSLRAASSLVDSPAFAIDFVSTVNPRSYSYYYAGYQRMVLSRIAGP
jgi:hypothetical protein